MKVVIAAVLLVIGVLVARGLAHMLVPEQTAAAAASIESPGVVNRDQVRTVRFTGPALPTRSLRDVVATRVGAILEADELEQDRARILALLADRGHVAARIDDVHLARGDGGVDVDFVIDPGPLYRVRNVEVVGSQRPLALGGLVTIMPGQQASQERVAALAARLHDYLVEQGEPGTVTPRVAIDHRDLAVDIVFQIAAASP